MALGRVVTISAKTELATYLTNTRIVDCTYANNYIIIYIFLIILPSWHLKSSVTVRQEGVYSIKGLFKEGGRETIFI